MRSKKWDHLTIRTAKYVGKSAYKVQGEAGRINNSMHLNPAVGPNFKTWRGTKTCPRKSMQIH
jgi:hypothetical protein